MGHQVRRALDGRTAVAAAMAYRPDVALLDLDLPVMSGLEDREVTTPSAGDGACTTGRAHWLGQDADRRETTEAGFDRHLTKPAEPEALEQLLASYAAHVVS